MVEPQYVQTDHNGDPLTDEEREQVMQHKVRPEQGFTKTNWKTADDRDKYAEHFEQFSEARTLAEWRSVLSDKTDRKAAIIHVTNTNREKWLRRVGDLGLHYRDIRYTAPYDGYAHEFKGTSADNPNRVTYAVIAENKDIADKMEEAELEMGGFERHDTVGELLGFPECCRRSFWDNFGVAPSTDAWVDPMYEIACNTPSAEPTEGDRQNLRLEDPDPRLNILNRYWGGSFITHMPCSFECEASAEIAQQRGEIMAEHGMRDTANAMYRWLDMPAVWEAQRGIVHVRNPAWIGSANGSGYWSMKRIVWKHEYDTQSVIETA